MVNWLMARKAEKPQKKKKFYPPQNNLNRSGFLIQKTDDKSQTFESSL